MKDNKLIRKGMKAMGEIDTNELIKMFKAFDKNFVTLSENQMFIQRNQVEFGKYLDDITTRLKRIEKQLNSLDTKGNWKNE